MDRPSSWRYTDLDLLLLRPCSSMSYQLYLEQFVLSNAQLILTGDLNLKLKDPTHPESETFAMITEQFGLTQHVAEPTHKLGGWLDVIITRDDCQVTDVTVHPPILSDHGLVMASIPFIYEPSLLITRRIRCILELRSWIEQRSAQHYKLSPFSTMSKLSPHRLLRTYSLHMRQ